MEYNKTTKMHNYGDCIKCGTPTQHKTQLCKICRGFKCKLCKIHVSGNSMGQRAYCAKCNRVVNNGERGAIGI